MKTTYKTIILIFAIFTLSMQSCKVIDGCTDNSAINYNSDATKDDGSCCFKAINSYQFPSTTDGFNQQSGWQWYQVQVTLNQTNTIYTGACDEQNTCETKASFTSACPHDTIVDIQITHGIGGETATLQDVLLPANGTINIDQIIFSFCQPLTLENFDISFN
jgi:hypothetical protein